ncbi:MAG: hypothetical protein ACRDYE_14725 [Acidimicrobiales bacterium]
MVVDHRVTTIRPSPDGTPSEGPGPTLDQTLAGLDALDRAGRSTRKTFAQRLWRVTLPKLIAFGIILLVWQMRCGPIGGPTSCSRRRRWHASCGTSSAPRGSGRPCE